MSLAPLLAAAALAAQQPAERVPIHTERSTRIAAPRPAAAAEPLLRFRDLPNVAVEHYEVDGRDVPAIHKSLAKKAPRDPATRRILPATSRWTVAVAVKLLTTGKSCTVTGATIDFRGSAIMPRLAADPERPAAVAAAWNAYAAKLESRQAAQLRFAHERLGEIERAVLASRCGRAQAAADAAIARLSERQRLAFAEEMRHPPQLEPPPD